jgi:hypothetical protein
MTTARSVLLAFVRRCGFYQVKGLKTLGPVNSVFQRCSMLRPSPPTTSPRNVHLSPGEMSIFKLRESVSLHLLCGGLWVTQTNDSRDHFLKAGQSMCLAPHRLTVLQGQGVLAKASMVPVAHATPLAHPFRLLLNLWRLGRNVSA